MGFFDFLSDTKDKMDRSAEAREFIRTAKRYVEEGEDIYANAYTKVFDYAYETRSRIEDHSSFKRKIARELESDVSVTLRKFSNFNIDSKIMEMPDINKLSVDLGGINSVLNTFSGAMDSCMPGGLDIPSLLDMFISDEDYYEARRQRDEARHFKALMKLEKAKLYGYKDQMSLIRNFISNEKRELEVLVGKVRKLSSELKEGMNKSKFTIDEATHLKALHKITEQIVDLLSTDFLGDNFKINAQYKKNFEGIKEINNLIPSSPDINDATVGDALKRVLDIVIVN